MGCHSCEVACKMEHDLPVGVNRMSVVVEGPYLVDGKLKLAFRRIHCRQCLHPPCIEACPDAAIIKRPDGIVYIEQSRCTGCQACAVACPYGAISFHPHKKRAEICDQCFRRLDDGLEPFCVKHCMSGALFFGTEEEFRKKKRLAVRR